MKFEIGDRVEAGRAGLTGDVRWFRATVVEHTNPVGWGYYVTLDQVLSTTPFLVSPKEMVRPLCLLTEIAEIAGPSPTSNSVEPGVENSEVSMFWSTFTAVLGVIAASLLGLLVLVLAVGGFLYWLLK